MYRAMWIDDKTTDIPEYGTKGYAYRDREYWMFRSDVDGESYYCESDQFKIIESDYFKVTTGL